MLTKFLSILFGVAIVVGMFCGILYGIHYSITKVTTIPETILEIIPEIMPLNLPRFNVEESSPTYDCKDATLDMVLQCEAKGYDYKIVSGNLDLENETFGECNHLWLWVDLGNDTWLAYDWGHLYFDKQHYYGYVVEREHLTDLLANLK